MGCRLHVSCPVDQSLSQIAISSKGMAGKKWNTKVKEQTQHQQKKETWWEDSKSYPNISKWE